MELKIKKLKEEAILPSYAHPGDAGMDLYSCEDYNLLPGERHLFGLGIASEFPEGFVALVRDKSGLAVKAGLTVLAGVIDHGYRGEWGVVLLNTGNEAYEIKQGDKIAQCLMQKVDTAEVTEAEELGDHSRGEGGFGSTGR